MTCPPIRLKTDYNSLRIYFGDMLHARVKWPLFSIQAWKCSERMYVIEYVGRDGTMTSDYDDIEKWKQILIELDKLEFT